MKNKEYELEVESSNHVNSPIDEEGRRDIANTMASIIRDSRRKLLRRRLTNTIVRSTPKIGRNDMCTCGSGKKYKKCCINK